MDQELLKEIGSIVNETIKTSSSELRIGIYVLLVLTLLNTILGVLKTIIDKRQDIKVATKITQRQCEMSITKEIYNDMKGIHRLLFDHSISVGDISEKISIIRMKVRDNSIEMRKNVISHFNELLDLFSINATDKTSRDIRKENDLFEKIEHDYRNM